MPEYSNEKKEHFWISLALEENKKKMKIIVKLCNLFNLAFFWIFNLILKKSSYLL